jgi:hypothetical protein
MVGVSAGIHQAHTASLIVCNSHSNSNKHLLLFYVDVSSSIDIPATVTIVTLSRLAPVRQNIVMLKEVEKKSYNVHCLASNLKSLEQNFVAESTRSILNG